MPSTTETHQSHPPTIHVSVGLMDALSTAERLAFENPTLSALIYQSAAKMSPDVLAGKVSPLIFRICLNTDPAPEGAEFLTSVTRRRLPAHVGRHPSMSDVVKQVVANLPAGVRLAHEAVLEHYPQRPRDEWSTAPEPSRTFAYQFMSTEGRNVATLIPDSGTVDGAQMQTGFDGRGRPWKDGTTKGERTTNIKWMVEEAEAEVAAAEVAPKTAEP